MRLCTIMVSLHRHIVIWHKNHLFMGLKAAFKYDVIFWPYMIVLLILILVFTHLVIIYSISFQNIVILHCVSWWNPKKNPTFILRPYYQALVSTWTRSWFVWKIKTMRLKPWHFNQCNNVVSFIALKIWSSEGFTNGKCKINSIWKEHFISESLTSAHIQTVHTAGPAPPCPNRLVCVFQSDTLLLWASTRSRFSHRAHTETWGEQRVLTHWVFVLSLHTIKKTLQKKREKKKKT